ncbi:MAG: carbohydrate ABC transporter permease [Chloroflexi bacterium]|nr:carbohydrate ABC transporter permease [Chloroflexota bacterium]
MRQGNALAPTQQGAQHGIRTPLHARDVWKTAKSILQYILLYGLGLLILAPFIWVALSAFKSESELLRYPPTLFPQRPTLDNFTQFFDATQFQRAMFNSALVATATTALALGAATPAAYALTRFHNRAFEWIARLFVYAYMIPSILLVLPVYRIFFRMGLSNTLYGLIIIYVALVMPLTLWTLRSFFAGIPVDLEEAAMIDGATRFGAFLRVVVPQAIPGMIATGIIALNVGWSEYLFGATLLSRPDVLTISPRLESFMGRGLFNWGWLMAGALAVTAPLIVVAGVAQRFLVAGWGAGAVKG